MSRASVRVVLPAALRQLAGGSAEIDLELGAEGGQPTLAHVVAAIRAGHPAVHDSLVTERGALRPHVNVFVDGVNSRFLDGLASAVKAGSEIMVLPAISGG